MIGALLGLAASLSEPTWEDCPFRVVSFVPGTATPRPGEFELLPRQVAILEHLPAGMRFLLSTHRLRPSRLSERRIRLMRRELLRVGLPAERIATLIYRNRPLEAARETQDEALAGIGLRLPHRRPPGGPMC